MPLSADPCCPASSASGNRWTVPAKGIPYIVFAGNVGDDESLAQVTRKLSNTF